jgi:hypothetical protein
MLNRDLKEFAELLNARGVDCHARICAISVDEFGKGPRHGKKPSSEPRFRTRHVTQ